MTQVFNLRQKGIVDGVDFKRVFYISLHMLDSQDVSDYGRKRVLRDLMDAWLEKRMSYAGIQFQDGDVSLTDAEMASIPGSDILKSVDSLKLEVTVRNGASIDVHPDEVKKWRSQHTSRVEEFEKLLSNHNAMYKDMLCEVLKTTSTAAAQVAAVTALVTGDPGIDAVNGKEDDPLAVTQFESLDKLQEEDPIRHRAASEVPDVELLRGASGKTYIMAGKKSRCIPKQTILAGFGTGKLLGLLGWFLQDHVLQVCG